MKQKILTILTALTMVFSLSACSQSHSTNTENHEARYARLMKQGKQAARDSRYAAAEVDFEDAQHAKDTKQARTYAKQADHLAEAKADINEYEFSDAKKALAKAADIDDGYAVMTDRAESLHSKIATVVRHFKDDINPRKRDAKTAMADHDYQAAIANYQDILDLPYINGKYYKRVRKQVKKLLAKAEDKADQARTAAANNNSNQSNNSNQASTNQAQSAQGSPAQANHSAPAGYVVGGQAVSMSGRGQIRSRLQTLGYDQTQFTDDQVVGIFNTAYQNGHQSPTEITRADVAQYLGQ